MLGGGGRGILRFQSLKKSYHQAAFLKKYVTNGQNQKVYEPGINEFNPKRDRGSSHTHGKKKKKKKRQQLCAGASRGTSCSGRARTGKKCYWHYLTCLTVWKAEELEEDTARGSNTTKDEHPQSFATTVRPFLAPQSPQGSAVFLQSQWKHWFWQFKNSPKLGEMVMQACNPSNSRSWDQSTQSSKLAWVTWWVQGQSKLHGETLSQIYVYRICVHVYIIPNYLLNPPM